MFFQGNYALKEVFDLALDEDLFLHVASSEKDNDRGLAANLGTSGCCGYDLKDCPERTELVFGLVSAESEGRGVVGTHHLERLPLDHLYHLRCHRCDFLNKAFK